MANSKMETFILAAIVLSAAIFFGWLLFKPEPEKKQPTIIKMVDLSEFHSLQMHQHGNMQMIYLTINNKNGVFILDTGAGESIFNNIFIDSLDIKMADSIPIPNTNIYLTDTLNVTSTDSLFRFQHQFFTYSLEGLKDRIVKIDSNFVNTALFGIIGQDVMQNEGMVLNFQNNKIYLTNKYKKQLE